MDFDEVQLRMFAFEALYGENIEYYLKLIEIDPVGIQTNLDRVFNYVAKGSILREGEKLDTRRSSK